MFYDLKPLPQIDSYDSMAGIWLKERSDIADIFFFDLPLSPRTATNVLFKSENRILVLI